VPLSAYLGKFEIERMMMPIERPSLRFGDKKTSGIIQMRRGDRPYVSMRDVL